MSTDTTAAGADRAGRPPVVVDPGLRALLRAVRRALLLVAAEIDRVCRE